MELTELRSDLRSWRITATPEFIDAEQDVLRFWEIPRKFVSVPATWSRSP
jgi:hypothetical protein